MTTHTLIMPIGIPASMKTTFMSELSDRFNIPMVSSDKVRKQLYGSEEVQGNVKEVFDEVYRQVNHWIECGCCILDATNVTRSWRDRAIARVCPDQVVFIIMDNDYERCRKRNETRERKVPVHVIQRMHKNFKRYYPEEGEVKNLRIFKYDDPKLIKFLEEI